jgi:ribose/xylose/arabinose/galactoside ABC-type transport system permease subunit
VEPGAQATPYPHNRRWKLIANGIWNVLLILLIAALLAVIAAASGGSGLRLMPMLAAQMLPLALVVPPLILLMASGELDLSAGAVIGLSGAILARMVAGGVPVVGAALACLIGGLVIGIVNGLLVGVARLNGALLTLAVAVLLDGIASAMLGGDFVRGPEGEWGAITAFGWIAAVLATVACILLVFLTPFGRRPLRRDPPEPRLRRMVYVGLPYAASGLLAGLAGVIVILELRFAGPGAGTVMQPRVLSAALIGGTPLGMGVANGFGGLLGALVVALLGVVQNLPQVRGGPPAVWLNGVVVVAGLLLSHAYHWIVGTISRGRGASPPPAE